MSDAAVVVQGLRKSYGSVVAVKGLDLEVPKGAVFGLLGPNGAGKSTTFGILCGWLRPTSGAAIVLGTPSHALHKLRGKVAALPQDTRFPPNVSIRDELVHFGRLQGLTTPEAQTEADRVLAEVGMQNAATLRGSELSHGMGKRVGLAQAILAKPEVVFLDEPTAGLDPKSARQVKDLIASLAPAATVVLSSHNLVDVQEICTHGAILDHGNLVVSGTIEKLTRRGAEITVQVAPGTKLPHPALDEAFGKDCVKFEEDVLTVSFESQQDAAEIIAKALRILLDAEVPILAVARGTSLETAFLEATKD